MAAEAPPPSFLNTSFDKLPLSSSISSMNEWFDNNDISGFLSQDVVMHFPQEAVPTTPDVATELQFYTPSPEVLCSDSSAYSSDSSETPSPFDQFSTDSTNHSGINSPIDETLFESYNLTDPLLVPEIEKILAGNPYQMDDVSTSQTEATSNPKKRQRETTEPKTPVTLSRDQLLTMTSKEIEDYASEIKAKRALTAAEEKELKRQRRLVKNREYASQSRSRKKQFVDDLEKQLEVARAEAEQYKQQNQTLIEENKVLKRQLGSIADTIKKVQQNGGAAGAAKLSASSGAVGVFDKLVKVGAGRATPPAKGVSACLLAIFFMVFTFAAFWDNESNFNKDGLNFRTSRNLFSDEAYNITTDPSAWEAATSLLRETWESSSSYLPAWETVYSLFASTYPFFFSSSSSSATSTILPSFERTEKIVPLKPTTTPHLHSSLPSTNKTCNHTLP